jgi:hypothetical protein
MRISCCCGTLINRQSCPNGLRNIAEVTEGAVRGNFHWHLRFFCQDCCLVGCDACSLVEAEGVCQTSMSVSPEVHGVSCLKNLDSNHRENL